MLNPNTLGRLGSPWGRNPRSSDVLSSYIAMACEPTLLEPNQALEMEIADYINTKKSNCPREAAFDILKHVNQGSPRSALLGLHLLDVLVKNCGYPFHLQIATKDFLNELVRRFPERPPAYPGPIMGKTLELINEWKNGVATTSKHKEDLVHVRDMWRLLGYKGYRFPELSRNAAISVATDNLKSPEELEEEDREAQSAKLQELIRRGTPRDLAAAQDLMKKLSGFDERKPDYRAQTLKELDKVQHKAILLNDMLDQAAQTQEKLVRGDAYDQVASLCKQASPKLQKWISDASESDSDLLERLLQINDLINNVVNRYNAFKDGDYNAKFEMNENFQSKGVISGSSNNRSEPQNLIDIDDPMQYEHVERDEGNDAGVQLGGASSEIPVDLFSAPSPGPSGSGDLPAQTQSGKVSSTPAANLSSNEALKSLYAMGPSMNTPVSYSQPFTPATQSPITPGLSTPANIINTTTSSAQLPTPQPQQTQQPQQPQQKSPFDDLIAQMENSDFSDSFDEADLLEHAALIESQYNHQRAQRQDERIRENQTAEMDSTIDYGEDFNSPIIIDDAAMEQLDRIETNSYNTPGTSQGLVQQRLWGAPPPPSSRPPPRPVMIQKEHSGAKKQWDYTAMSKSSKQRKQKAKAEEDGDMIIEDDPIEFEQFPSVSIGNPPPPMKHSYDPQTIKSWVYPTNYPIRDYQINITTQCLFQNTLVALPTGLGKTLIAGVVIMNYYKWFPTAKVIFLAPTKPLVDQQAKACHDVCGIPQSDVCILYGDVAQHKRKAIIKEKRVLYMTPQTLNNDLQKGVCDPRDVVLIVIDEAHKGQGDYSYCSVVRYMMKTNPHFRILALTATPGNTPEQVQPIIDNLHISHIAIRNDSSQDIKQYTHKKVFEEHIIKMDYFIDELCMQWEDVVKRAIDPLIAKDLLPDYTINRLRKIHPYQITSLRNRILPHQRYLFGNLNKAGDAVRAMRNLQIQSIELFYQNLQELIGKKQDPDTKKTIEKLITSIESERVRRNGRLSHPKMEKVESLLLDHFTNFSSEDTETRAIVFASLRDTVEEVVEQINTHSPILRAAAFVGQAAANGKKGLNQKQQQQVMNDYKEGKFNVLVSTSIGEEGLDIGDIDLTITYDPGRSSISMLQKIGRTGRKRQGHVHTLMAAELEDKNWDEAQARHQDVQSYIVSGDQVALYNDVERLVPDDIEPECEKRHVQVEEWESFNKKDAKKDSASADISNSSTKALKPKRKRNNDPVRNMPKEATSGFVNAGDLVEKKTDTIAMNIETDSEDEALQKGVSEFQSQKELQPLKLEPSGPSLKRNQILKNKPSQTLQRQPSQAARQQASQLNKSSQSVAALSKTLSLRTHSITLHDDEDEVESPRPTQSTKRQRTRSPTPMSPTSSPVLVLNKPPILKSPSEPPFGSKKRSKKGFKAPRLLLQESPVIDLDSDQVDSPVAVTGRDTKAKRKDGETFKTPARPLNGKNANNSCMSVDSSPLVVNNTRMNVQENTYIKPFHYEPKSILSIGSPDQSQVVRRPGQSLIAPRTTGKSIISSSPRGTPYHPFKRLRQRSSSNASPMAPQPTTKRSKLMMKPGEYIDFDAQVSDNEDVSGDERSSEVDALSEGDIDFVAGDQSQFTDNESDYNQQAAYVMGLATQVPNGGGPRFDTGPIRNPVGFMLGSKEAAHRPMLLSSSPNVVDPDDTYDYEDGFVVDDDQF